MEPLTLALVTTLALTPAGEPVSRWLPFPGAVGQVYTTGIWVPARELLIRERAGQRELPGAVVEVVAWGEQALRPALVRALVLDARRAFEWGRGNSVAAQQAGHLFAQGTRPLQVTPPPPSDTHYLCLVPESVKDAWYGSGTAAFR